MFISISIWRMSIHSDSSQFGLALSSLFVLDHRARTFVGVSIWRVSFIATNGVLSHLNGPIVEKHAWEKGFCHCWVLYFKWATIKGNFCTHLCCEHEPCFNLWQVLQIENTLAHFEGDRLNSNLVVDLLRRVCSAFARVVVLETWPMWSDAQ